MPQRSTPDDRLSGTTVPPIYPCAHAQPSKMVVLSVNVCPLVSSVKLFPAETVYATSRNLKTLKGKFTLYLKCIYFRADSMVGESFP